MASPGAIAQLVAYSSAAADEEEEEQHVNKKKASAAAATAYGAAASGSGCGDGASFGSIFGGAFVAMGMLVAAILAFIYFVVIPPLKQQADYLLLNMRNSIEEADQNQNLIVALDQRLNQIANTLNEAKGLNSIPSLTDAYVGQTTGGVDDLTTG